VSAAERIFELREEVKDLIELENEEELENALLEASDLVDAVKREIDKR